MEHAITFQAGSSGGFEIGGTVATSGIVLHPAVAGRPPSIASFGSEANSALALAAKGNAPIILQSPLVANREVKLSQPVKLPVYVVATLPECTRELDQAMASVTDAVAPTYNGALRGGGSSHIPVFCNGVAWTAH